MTTLDTFNELQSCCSLAAFWGDARDNLRRPGDRSEEPLAETPLDPDALAARSEAYRTLLEQLAETTISGRTQALAERDATIARLERELAKVTRDLGRLERRLSSITGAPVYRALAAARRLVRPARGPERIASPEVPQTAEPAPPVPSGAPAASGSHVLVADEHVPTPDRDAGSGRMFALVRILAEAGRRVTFVPMDMTRREPYTSALQAIGAQVWHDGREIVSRLQEAGPTLDAAVLSRPPVALVMLPLIRRFAPAARIAFDSVDLHFIRERRRFSVEHAGDARAAAERFQALETALTRLSDAVIVTTEDERRVIEDAVPGARTYVIPTIHEVRRGTPGAGARRDVVLVGNFAHHPNRDAAAYLVREIWPLVRREIAGAKLLLVGYDPKGTLRELASEDVSAVGWVDDLEPYLDRARVFAAPLRFGAGIKGKIGAALAAGIPVVTTSVGAEGMDLRHERDALIAADAQSFAAAVVRVYRDDELWNTLSRQGKEHVRSRYTSTVVRSTVEEMLSDLVPATP